MEATESLCLTFFQICENSFYFEDLKRDAGFLVDSFQFSRESNLCWIQSKDRKFLVLKSAGELEFQERSSEERKQPDCHFHMQIYKDSSTETGLQPVLLYTRFENKVNVVCCRDENVICPEHMDLAALKNIDGTGHKALFYKKKISCDKYIFESTLYKGRVLAFEPDENNSCLHRLILCTEEDDEVNQSLYIFVSDVDRK